MENALSVDEFGLLNFFTVIPVQRDEDVPWVYNDSQYEIMRGQNQLSFAIAPAYRDVRIRLRANGVLLYELNAMGVADVKIHNDKGHEWLEVVASERHSIRLRIGPEISINEKLEDLR